MEIRIGIIRMEGTNCEDETYHAFRHLGCNVDYIHIKEIEGKRKKIEEYDGLVIPGGFSAGDYVRAGAIFAARLRASAMKDLAKFVEDGKPVLGICNGFQVLIELGLLPALYGISDEPEACLAANDSNRFECRETFIRHEGNSKLTQNIPVGEVKMVPCAHAEGKFMFMNEEYAQEAKKQVVFRYVNERGEIDGYPWNPNGSYDNIAGISNPDGNVLGMMPHPERVFHEWQALNKRADGREIFEGMISYIKGLK